jgi:hypothetical protein
MGRPSAAGRLQRLDADVHDRREHVGQQDREHGARGPSREGGDQARHRADEGAVDPASGIRLRGGHRVSRIEKEADHQAAGHRGAQRVGAAADIQQPEERLHGEETEEACGDDAVVGGFFPDDVEAAQDRECGACAADHTRADPDEEIPERGQAGDAALGQRRLGELEQRARRGAGERVRRSGGRAPAPAQQAGGEGAEGLAPLRGHRVAEADIDEGTAGERGIKDVASEAAVDHLAEDDAEDDADDRHPEGDRRWQREGVEQGRDEDRRRDRLATRPGEGRFGEVRGGADR